MDIHTTISVTPDDQPSASATDELVVVQFDRFRSASMLFESPQDALDWLDRCRKTVLAAAKAEDRRNAGRDPRLEVPHQQFADLLDAIADEAVA